MKSVMLNHWYVIDNKLSISLLSFYVEIEMNSTNQEFLLKVFDNYNDKKELPLKFYSLEEAIYFTEEFISKCKELNEVEIEYEEYMINNKNKVYKKEV